MTLQARRALTERLHEFASRMQDRFERLNPILIALRAAERKTKTIESTQERLDLYKQLHNELQFFLRRKSAIFAIIGQVISSDETLPITGRLLQIQRYLERIAILDAEIVTLIETIGREGTALKSQNLQEFATLLDQEAQQVRRIVPRSKGLFSLFRRPRKLTQALVGALLLLLAATTSGCVSMQRLETQPPTPVVHAPETIGVQALRLQQEAGATQEDIAWINAVIEESKEMIKQAEASIYGNTTFTSGFSRLDSRVESYRTWYQSAEESLKDNLEASNKEVLPESTRQMFADFMRDDEKKLAKLRKEIRRDVFFFSVAAVLKARKIKFQETLMIHEGLKKDALDCDTSSLVYVSVAESLGYPVFLVIVPNHVFVRWDESQVPDGDTSFNLNWETNDATSMSEKHYLGKRYFLGQRLNKASLRNGVHMKSLPRHQQLGLAYFQLASYFQSEVSAETPEERQAMRLRALDAIDRCIELIPNWDSAYSIRATLRALLGDDAGKEADYRLMSDCSPY